MFECEGLVCLDKISIQVCQWESVGGGWCEKAYIRCSKEDDDRERQLKLRSFYRVLLWLPVVLPSYLHSP